MSHLNINYQHYQNYMKWYAEGDTNFVYYVDMNNEAGDIYTNRGGSVGTKKSEIEKYFDDLICAAAGTTALYYDISGDYEVSQEDITNYIDRYHYAFGNEAVVYAGYDFSLGVKDPKSTVWEAYTYYDLENMYGLLLVLSACVLYYIFIMLYLIYTTGRKIDRDGEEYIELKWNDSVYTELFLGWCVALGFGIAFIACIFYEHFYYSAENYIGFGAAVIIAAGSFLVSIFTTEAVCSLARRVKARTVLKNSLSYKIILAQIIRFVLFSHKPECST